MASLDGFDPSQVPDQIVIPAGKYPGIVTGSEIKETKKGGSQYVFSLKVVGGEYNGTMLFWRIHKKVENATAKQIADRELKKLCVATNRMNPRDTADFHNISLIIDVGQEARADTGETVNRINGVEPVGGMPAAASRQATATATNAPVAAPVAPAQQNGTTTPPATQKPVAAPWARPAQ